MIIPQSYELWIADREPTLDEPIPVGRVIAWTINATENFEDSITPIAIWEVEGRVYARGYPAGPSDRWRFGPTREVVLMLALMSAAPQTDPGPVDTDAGQQDTPPAELWGRLTPGIAGGIVGMTSRDAAIRHATAEAATSSQPIRLYAGTGQPETWTHQGTIFPGGDFTRNETPAAGETR